MLCFWATLYHIARERDNAEHHRGSGESTTSIENVNLDDVSIIEVRDIEVQSNTKTRRTQWRSQGGPFGPYLPPRPLGGNMSFAPQTEAGSGRAWHTYNRGGGFGGGGRRGKHGGKQRCQFWYNCLDLFFAHFVKFWTKVILS